MKEIKKVIIVIVMVLSILLLTGCGKQCVQWEYTPGDDCTQGGKYQQAYCRSYGKKATQTCVMWE